MKRFGGTFSHLLDELVRERTGLAPSRRHEDTKARVLGKAMERAGMSDETMYLALLKRDAKAYDDLIADLTVPETYFFRDPATYEMLRREVLPQILATNDRKFPVEVWSAGCASGEEPYSLTMLLEQAGLEKRSRVLGTDVSFRALARARAGVYSRWSLRATNERDRARYFEVTGTEYRLISRIRSRPCFRQHSLSSGAYPGPQGGGPGFDLILCRNVLIYFAPQSTLETAQRLARSLTEGGWLLMGPSDPRLEIDEWCDVTPSPCGLLYRRRRTSSEVAEHHGWHSQSPAARGGRPQFSLPTAPVPTQQALPSFPSQASGLPAPMAIAPLGEPRTAASTGSHAKAAPLTLPAAAAIEQVLTLEREHGSLAAETGCRDLLSSEPLSAGLHVVHASLLLDLGRDAAAEQALRRAMYLDRSLLIAQLLGATLAERRGQRDEAARVYAQLHQACRALPAELSVPLGEGLTYGALAELSEQRARALSPAANRSRA